MRSLLKSWVGRGRIEVLLTFRDRRTIMFTVLLPLILLLVLSSLVHPGDLKYASFAQYLTAGMVASGLVYGGFQGLAISIPEERSDGTLKRLYGTPMPRSAYFVGKIINVVVIYVIQVVLMVGLGVTAYHVTIPTSSHAIITFVWLSALALVTFTSLGIAFSSLAKTGQAAAAIATPLVLFLQFTSGVFFVVTTEPAWMRTIASVFPLRWMCQGMRSVFLPARFGSQELGGGFHLTQVALIMSVWAIVGLVLCFRTFRWLPIGED